MQWPGYEGVEFVRSIPLHRVAWHTTYAQLAHLALKAINQYVTVRVDALFRIYTTIYEMN